VYAPSERIPVSSEVPKHYNVVKISDVLPVWNKIRDCEKRINENVIRLPDYGAHTIGILKLILVPERKPTEKRTALKSDKGME
jgi:hypothetical protein